MAGAELPELENLSPPAWGGRIEPANWRDLGALRSLEQVCFPKDSWPLWDLIGVLTLPNVVRLKVMDDGEMVGFIAGDHQGAKGIAWIVTVGVLPAYRRRGIGKALIAACEEQLATGVVRLSVRASNAEAIRLYRSLGYLEYERWVDYYQDGEDAVVMEKLVYL